MKTAKHPKYLQNKASNGLRPEISWPQMYAQNMKNGVSS
jgi:hypothetical protein